MSKEKNLLWLDLEMTGLNSESDVILEIASVITDSQLTILAEGPSIVIHQQQEYLDRMAPVVAEMHTKSGLINLVATSTVSLEQATEKMIQFLRSHAEKHDLVLAGNTVWQDRAFLVKYMPAVMDFLHYRIVDVTAIKEVVRRWYPHNQRAFFKKPENHRAYEDVLTSIAELKHYRMYFFVRP